MGCSHAMQFSSCPISTFAARIACMIPSSSGLVMADVMPLVMAIEMKCALSVSRPGRPNETLLAPQTVLTPSSSRTIRTISKTCLPEPRTAPAGITSGSISTSSGGMP